MSIAVPKKRALRYGAAVLLLSLLCLCVCAPVRAAEIGQSLYSARFAEYTSLRDTGVYLGTASGRASAMRLTEDGLRLSGANGEKAYLLLPDAETADTCVIEFTFRFSEIASSNGYLGFLLASSGDAPSGRTELLFRAGGTVDGYISDRVDALYKAASAGEPIQVRILVNYDYMMDFRIFAGGEEIASAAPSKLVQVNPTGWGFVVRNASVLLESVRVLKGGYDVMKTENIAPNYIAPADWKTPVMTAPPTGDAVWLYGVSAALAALGAGKLRRRK